MDLNCIIKLITPANHTSRLVVLSMNYSKLVGFIVKKRLVMSSSEMIPVFFGTLWSWNHLFIVIYPAWDLFVFPFEHSSCKLRNPSGLKHKYMCNISMLSQWYRWQSCPPSKPLLFSFCKKIMQWVSVFFLSPNTNTSLVTFFCNSYLFLFQDTSKALKWKKILIITNA